MFRSMITAKSLLQNGQYYYYHFKFKKNICNFKFHYFQGQFQTTIKRTLKCSSINNVKVGFIGIGNMGSNMCANLQKNGHELILYDPNPNAIKDLIAGGNARSVSSPAEVAQQSERVFTMVPFPTDVLNVYTGPNGLIANARKETILIDSSTVDPETSKKIETEASAKGIRFVDAPVTGAVPAARAGTLTFIVGGPKETVDELRELLLCMGKNVIHCGTTGMGSVAKLCNNMMLAISMIGTAETLNLARRSGLDPKLMTDILNISSGRTWVSEGYNPVPGVGSSTTPSSNDYDKGFRSSLLAKDLNLAQLISVQSQSPTPMGSTASQYYRILVNNEKYADKDFSAIYEFLKGQKN